VVPESPTRHQVVSSDAQSLILVDASDQPVGTLDKASCHDGEGVLHRAISVFLFNAAGQLLIQQRHRSKRLWPSFWSNSCCSHPRAGEDTAKAAARRVEEELGTSAELVFVYKFEYQAHFGAAGSEHELCSVFLGHTDTEPVINTTEIDAWRWIDTEALDRQLKAEPETFTPWFKLEWRRLNTEFKAALEATHDG
jgi:isopentenyl-diphosphate delta-isomerase